METKGIELGKWGKNPVDSDYLQVMFAILKHGGTRNTRAGETMAIFSRQLRFDVSKYIPILTTKKVIHRSVIGELLWFLDGGRDMGYRLDLAKLSELIGEKSAYAMWGKNQEIFQGKQFSGDCGRIYGAQWRNWNGDIDQIKNLMHLLKTDPTSRYMVVNAWNPSETSDMCLPPCHMSFQCFVRNIGGAQILDLEMRQRSCDWFLGVPYNILSYAILLHMLAHCSGMEPGELIINFGDIHLYMEHINCGAVETQLGRDSIQQTATLHLNPEVRYIDSFTMKDIEIRDYSSHDFIEAVLL